jgi:hypothetical protein
MHRLDTARFRSVPTKLSTGNGVAASRLVRLAQHASGVDIFVAMEKRIWNLGSSNVA